MTVLRIAVVIPVLLASVLTARQGEPELSSVEGKVINVTTGEPLADVTITRLIGGPPPPTGPPRRINAQTDATGRFLIDTLEPGLIEMSFAKDRYVPITLTYTLQPGQRLRDTVIRMTAKGVITGRVFDSSGKPLARAQVQPLAWQFWGNQRRLFARTAASTDDRGEFRLIDLEPGKYLINMSRGGGSAPPAPTLLQAASANGAVLYPGVATIAEATFVELKSGEETHLSDVTLNAQMFGPIRVSLANDSLDVIENLVVTVSNTTPVAILEQIDARYSLELWNSSTRSPRETNQIQPGAKLSLVYWPNGPGRYEVTARGRDAANTEVATTTSIDFDGLARDVDLRLPPVRAGRLTCRFVPPEGTAPLAQEPGSIVLRSIANRQLSCPASSFPVRSGSVPVQTGRYNIDFLSLSNPDWYVISVRDGNRDVLTDGFILGQDDREIEVRIGSGAGVVQGKITDAQGKGVQEAIVALLPESPTADGRFAISWQSSRSDQNGRFEIRRVIPGAYRLYAWSTIDANAYLDPEFMAKYKESGKALIIRAGDKISQDLVEEPR